MSLRGKHTNGINHASRIGRVLLTVLLAIMLCPGVQNAAVLTAMADPADGTNGGHALRAPLQAQADEPWAPAGIVSNPSGNLAKDQGATIVDNTKFGITMNMFDYYAVDAAEWGRNENNFGHVQSTGINAGRNNNNSGQVGADNMTHLQFYANGTQGFGINNFAGYDNNHWDGYHSINNDNKYSQQYAMQGIVQSSLGSDGFPVLNTSNGGSLSYLFNTSSTANAKDVYENVNGLFYLTNEGRQDEMMTYNSNQTYAYYNRGTNSFEIYNDTYGRYSGSSGTSDKYAIGFFPLDEYNGGPNGTGASKPGVSINPTQSQWNSYNHVNHHLGLTMSATVNMPYDGLIYDKDTGQSEDMIFKFSGDDDMWVFIDGKLVLDVGGIHQPVEGTINFHTGEIRISSGTAEKVQQNSYTMTARTSNSNTGALVNTTADDAKVRGDVSYLWGTDEHGNPRSKNGQNGNGASIFGNQWRAGTAHTVQFFYMERGGCDSNLEISTNMHKLMPRTAETEKQWDSSTRDEDKVPVQVQLIRKAIDRVTGQVIGYAEVGDPVTLDNSDNWSTSWADLPSEGYNPTAIFYTDKGDYGVTGNESDNRYCDYTYLVREIPKEGYRSAYTYTDASTGESVTITPEAISKMTNMAFEVANSKDTNVNASVSRTAKDHDSGDSYASGSGTFGPYALNSGNYYEYGVDDTSASLTYESEGKTRQLDYTYTLNPSVDGVTITQTRYGMGNPDNDAESDAGAVPSDFAKVVVTNTPIYIEVEKKWLNSKGQDETSDAKHDSDSVWVQLQKQTLDTETGAWGSWENEGKAVKLTKNMDTPWKTEFLISNSENVRYRVQEGTSIDDGTTFASSNTIRAAGKTYHHSSTDYTESGLQWPEDIYIAKQDSEGTTVNQEYYWEKIPVSNEDDAPNNYLRTFDGESELIQHTGTNKDKFETDTITVELRLPALAANIPANADSAYDYNAKVTLNAPLAASMTEPEEGSDDAPKWDVEAGGQVSLQPSQLTLDSERGTITVNVPAATAKAQAGKTITLTVPVKGKTEANKNLTTINKDNSATVTVNETKYKVLSKDGDSSPFSEGSGGEYVSLDADGTGASAVISNKPLVTKLTVQKKWADGKTYDHDGDSVWVRILDKDGNPASSVDPNPVELKKDMGQDEPEWTYTFEDLIPGGTYTVQEGTNDIPEGGSERVFKPTDEFVCANGKTYILRSLKYYNANGTERTKTESEKEVPIGSIDGAVAPDAGKAILENGIPSADIRMVKVDAETEVRDETGHKAPLEGAKFKLYKDAMGDGQTEATFTAEVDLVAANLVGKDIGTEEEPNVITEYTTDENGLVDFPALEPGFYWLVETGAPDGYMVRDADHPVGIEVDTRSIPHIKGLDDDNKPIDADDATYDTDLSRPEMGKVVDTQGNIVMWDHDEDPDTPEVAKTAPSADGEAYGLVFPDLRTYILPSTGGLGMFPFLLIGSFIAAFAIGTAASRRRTPASSSSAANGYPSERKRPIRR